MSAIERLGLGIGLSLLASIALAQAPAGEPEPSQGGAQRAPDQVDVRPGAADEAIQERLLRILSATGWFEDPAVEVREGVVFLQGTAQAQPRKRWAEDLARRTEDVVAVVNQMELAQPPLWDLRPALSDLRGLIARVLSGLPGAAFALLVLAATWILSRAVRAGVAWWADRRIRTPLLRRLAARAAAICVIVLGVYLILYLSGLTRLAVTVLGGTGLVGLIVGVAFRDITENFLASVFLSWQQPFHIDDLVEVAGTTGFVQRTTFRSTILLTLDGNHVQIPNAAVYQAVICNFTSNPNRREHFDVGIGYEVPISKAQEVAREVLRQHPAVLSQPEPWVLVDRLGSASVVLRVYFWLDGTQHSWLKVRSSVIRLVKRAFEEASIDMPDEAREVVFPRALSVRMLSPENGERRPAAERDLRGRDVESGALVTRAEGRLDSETETLRAQARASRSPEDGENLLRR